MCTFRKSTAEPPHLTILNPEDPAEHIKAGCDSQSTAGSSLVPFHQTSLAPLIFLAHTAATFLSLWIQGIFQLLIYSLAF